MHLLLNQANHKLIVTLKMNRQIAEKDKEKGNIIFKIKVLRRKILGKWSFFLLIS